MAQKPEVIPAGWHDVPGVRDRCVPPVADEIDCWVVIPRNFMGLDNMQPRVALQCRNWPVERGSPNQVLVLRHWSWIRLMDVISGQAIEPPKQHSTEGVPRSRVRRKPNNHGACWDNSPVMSRQ